MPEFKMEIPGFTITAVSTSSTPPPATGQRRPAAAKGNGLFVVGSKVFDGNGAPFVMKGVNATLAWGASERNFAALAEIAETKANTVRLVLHDAFPNYADKLGAVLDECARLKIVAVPGLWMATGKDDVASLDACVSYWLRPENTAALRKHERSVVLNIANEWGSSGPQGFDGARWRTVYAAAIAKLRAAGINCLIMVDAGGAFGQNPRSIRDYGTSLLSADSNNNLVFGLHLYAYWRTAENVADVGRWNDAGSQSPWRLSSELKSIVDKGIPLVIGEVAAAGPQIGYTPATALAEIEGAGVGWLAWSWNQNSDGALDVIPGGGYLFDGVASVQPTARVFFDDKIGFPSAKPLTTW